jgi:hypothetical protein
MSLTKIAHDYSVQIEKEAGKADWAKKVIGWGAKQFGKLTSQTKPGRWTSGKVNDWANKNAPWEAPAQPSTLLDQFGAPFMNPGNNSKPPFKNLLAQKIQSPANRWDNYSQKVQNQIDNDPVPYKWASRIGYPVGSVGVSVGGAEGFNQYKQYRLNQEKDINYKTPTPNQNRASFGK